MPSLEFKNLPLKEVSVNFIFENAEEPSFEDLKRLTDEFHDDFPVVIDFMGGVGNASPIAFVVGPSVGVSISGKNNGCRIEWRPNLLKLAWRADTGVQYPRYLALKEWAKRALKVVGTTSRAVNLSYVLEVPEAHGEFEELIESQFAPKVPGDRIETQLCWRESSGIDFRMQYHNKGPDFLLATTAGLMVEARKEMEGLEKVHEFLNGNFKTMITEKAKKIWQLTAQSQNPQ